MTETKIREQRLRQIQEADGQDLETADKLYKEPTVEVYFDRDEEHDEPIVNADGSISYIARCVNINGVQWQIPAEERVSVPQSVYEILKRSEDARRKLEARTDWTVKVPLFRR